MATLVNKTIANLDELLKANNILQSDVGLVPRGTLRPSESAGLAARETINMAVGRFFAEQGGKIYF